MVLRKHTLFIFHYSESPLDIMSHSFEDCLQRISKWNLYENTHGCSLNSNWQLISNLINKLNFDEKRPVKQAKVYSSDSLNQRPGHADLLIIGKAEILYAPMCTPYTAAVPQGQEDGLAWDHGVNKWRQEKRGRRKCHKKPRSL